jgi:hypothetical protein
MTAKPPEGDEHTVPEPVPTVDTALRISATVNKLIAEHHSEMRAEQGQQQLGTSGASGRGRLSGRRVRLATSSSNEGTGGA